MTTQPTTPEKPAMLFAKTTRTKEIAGASKLLYGFPKTGKTTLASVQRSADGREPLFVATEDGHAALEVYCQRVTTWEGFARLCDHIVKNADAIRAQHSCIVLDIITDLDQWCAQAVAKKHNVAHISDLDYGKGFALSKEELSIQLTKLGGVLPLTYIAHAAEKEINWNGEKIKVQSPSLSKGALDWVNGKVDMIGYISPASTKKEKAELLFKPEKGTIAGSRFPQLAKSFQIDYANPAATMQAIQHAFAGTAPAHENTTPKGETK